MAARPSPTVQRRRLGVELRRLREQAGKTIEEVAQALECSDSKVSRIETGQVGATPRDVRDMLDLYGIRDEERDALVQLARQARRRGWWQAYNDTPVVPLVGLEAAADRIYTYEQMVVPGLLQTSEYAGAVLRVGRPDLSPQRIARWLELRMARQAIFTRENAPAFLALFEEDVLRRPVGGNQVMEAQIGHLIEMASLPTVVMQILPSRVGAHAAMSGAFTIYSFSNAADPDVVYLEHAASDLYLESAQEVRRYTLVFERLRMLALSPSDSTALLASLVPTP